MNLTLAIMLAGGSAFAVWYALEDPEGGAVAGLRGLLNATPQPKRTSVVGAAFVQNALGGLTAGGGGSAVSTVATAGGGIGTVTGSRAQVLAQAETWLGTPYLWGGTTKAGADCSGFTQAVYATAGVNLPRVSGMQALTGRGISEAQAQPGDLVAFGVPVHHVGIYLGNGAIIHAPKPGGVVRHESIWRTEPVFFRDVLGGAAPAKAAKPSRARTKRRKPKTVAT